MRDPDLDYLQTCIEEAPLISYHWDGEDKNIAAFKSKLDMIQWYCRPPGQDGEPYRDRGFYARELAMISRRVRPRRVVEFGTSLGIGTCLLRWLNPQAHLITVDIERKTFMPGNRLVQIGHLALWQQFKCDYVCCKSQDYLQHDVDMCFIDADHSYTAVLADSYRAWDNRSRDYCWAVVWHDHNARHPGVVSAVSEFCDSKGLILQCRLDSDTVWIEGHM